MTFESEIQNPQIFHVVGKRKFPDLNQQNKKVAKQIPLSGIEKWNRPRKQKSWNNKQKESKNVTNSM